MESLPLPQVETTPAKQKKIWILLLVLGLGAAGIGYQFGPEIGKRFKSNITEYQSQILTPTITASGGTVALIEKRADGGNFDITFTQTGNQTIILEGVSFPILVEAAPVEAPPAPVEPPVPVDPPPAPVEPPFPVVDPPPAPVEPPVPVVDPPPAPVEPPGPVGHPTPPSPAQVRIPKITIIGPVNPKNGEATEYLYSIEMIDQP